ncbi:MAG: mannose-1-phosphate guanylyltransferase [Bacteroidales bacterium]
MNNNNYCVIMGGGVGTRFWPFSRTNYPKQFLDFFGTGRSLLQMTYDRFVKIIPKEQIYIVTNEIYADVIKEQLPELSSSQVLFEPARRNTAPCIAWASYHIRSINPDANIVVAPSDHLILKEDVFLDTISKGLDFVATNDSLLTLGVLPNRPETGYGYIQTGKEFKDDFYCVKTFTEKPNLELAKVFLESGEFFWNSGIFLWNVSTIISSFEKLTPEIASCFENAASVYGNEEAEREYIRENFPMCPNVSIDYGVMEKADNTYVISADFGWSDLGTWGSLYELSNKDEQENVALKCKSHFYESSRNIVTLADGKLAVIQGLNDYIVTESGNVLLICQKEEEQRIRQFVADTQMNCGEEYV